MSRDKPRRRLPTHLWTRLGLRARVTLMFGLGALLFSFSMGAISYLIVRHVLADEQQGSSLQLAESHATSARTLLQQLEQRLKSPTSASTFNLTPQTFNTIYAGADSGSTSFSVVQWDGRWHSSTSGFGQKALPPDLRRLVVSDGRSATQTYTEHGTTVIAVGFALTPVKGAYFQIFVVNGLNHTLQVLVLALLGAGIFTTLLGAAVGRWASGSSLRPLTGVSRAAVAIADGQLDTRLAAVPGDPDLEGLTKSFNRMVDQLQERIEREARFTSDVSHELRSPLTTMAASLDVLDTHGSELSPTARQALELLSADLHRFQRMVAELLEISRSDAGSADVSVEEVDPGELTRQAVAAATRALPPGIWPPTVVVDAEVDTLRLMVDKRRFQRVVTNLIENAAHYGRGATTVRVTAGTLDTPAAIPNPRARSRRRAARPGSRMPPTIPATRSVLVCVEDHGPGVAPSERTRIFQRFYRGQASGQRGAGHGTGLGLALVAEHVRLHQGRVWVEDAEGGGARFCVELPALTFEPEPDDETRSQDQP